MSTRRTHLKLHQDGVQRTTGRTPIHPCNDRMAQRLLPEDGRHNRAPRGKGNRRENSTTTTRGP